MFSFSRRTGLQTVQAVSSVCFFSFGTVKVCLLQVRFLHGLPWHACVETRSVYSWTRPNCLPLKKFFSLPLGARMFSPFSFCCEPLRKLLLGNSRSNSEILFGHGILQMHLWGDITRNCHATWVQVQIPTAWLVIDIRLICRLDFFSLSVKSKEKISIAMVLRSHYSQFLLFSKSLTSSAIPDGVVKFLE